MAMLMKSAKALLWLEATVTSYLKYSIVYINKLTKTKCDEGERIVIWRIKDETT